MRGITIETMPIGEFSQTQVDRSTASSNSVPLIQSRTRTDPVERNCTLHVRSPLNSRAVSHARRVNSAINSPIERRASSGCIPSSRSRSRIIAHYATHVSPPRLKERERERERERNMNFDISAKLAAGDEFSAIRGRLTPNLAAFS